MKINRLVLMALLSLALSLFIPISSKAIHKGAGNLVCGQCHTMHSSQGGTNSPSMGGPTGSFLLLRTGNSSINSRAEIHTLCLQCHGDAGSQKDVVHAPQNVIAPKVYSSASWDYTIDAFNKIGAGGNFFAEINSSTSFALGFGHSVGITSGIPPGGDTDMSSVGGFSCTNCHDPHGTSSTADANTNIFRNLKVKATGAGAKSGVKFYVDANFEYYKHKSYVGGVNPSGTSGYFGGTTCGNGIISGTVPCDEANQAIWPVYRGTLENNPSIDSANSNQYGTGTEPLGSTIGDDISTMSKWCAQCHDNWHERYISSNKLGTWYHDWARHPVNRMVPRASSAGCAGSCHASLLDRTNYSDALIKAGKGLPVTTSKFSTSIGVYYLPTDTTGNLDGMDDLASGDNHKVFCLSCHFAHGGPYYDNLRWDYTSSVSAGDQEGNSIPSNVGCQLCHNR